MDICQFTLCPGEYSSPFPAASLIQARCDMGPFPGSHFVSWVFVAWWIIMAHNSSSLRLYRPNYNRLIVCLPPQALSSESIDAVSCRTWVMVQGSVGAFLLLGGFHGLMPAIPCRSHAVFYCSMYNGRPSICFVRSVRLSCSHRVPSLTLHRQKVRFCLQYEHVQDNNDTSTRSFSTLFASFSPSKSLYWK